MMCYLGNKTKLLTFIEKVIDKYKIEGETFADLFAGTGSIGDYFKGKYTVYSNDYMYFSKVISEAKLSNFTEDNTLNIDGMRLDIEELFHEGYISKAEYSYLLASLLD